MNKKALITSQCVGCSRCIAVCPEAAIKINWNESSDNTQKKMVEYAAAIVKALNSKIIYLNIVKDISPDCDCFPGNDRPIAEDIGFLASTDPVALDKASYDLVCQKTGKDPFKEVHQNINTVHQFEYAAEVGFGSIDYHIVNIE